MSWEDILVNRLRYILGDFDSSSFTNSQLSYFIAIAATIVLEEVNPPTDFIINTDVPTISPDPTSNSNYRGIAVLFVLKAACLAATAELRKDATSLGIRIKDDLAEYDTKNQGSLRLDMSKVLCEEYENIQHEYEQTGSISKLGAIFGPYADANEKTHMRSFRRGGIDNWF